MRSERTSKVDLDLADRPRDCSSWLRDVGATPRPLLQDSQCNVNVEDQVWQLLDFTGSTVTRQTTPPGFFIRSFPIVGRQSPLTPRSQFGVYAEQGYACICTVESRRHACKRQGANPSECEARRGLNEIQHEVVLVHARAVFVPPLPLLRIYPLSLSLLFSHHMSKSHREQASPLAC